MNEVSVSVVPDLEALITQINGALERGDWVQVVELTAPLHQCASALGELQLADLVQDLHWIANDALVNPLFVTSLLSEVLP